MGPQAAMMDRKEQPEWDASSCIQLLGTFWGQPAASLEPADQACVPLWSDAPCTQATGRPAFGSTDCKNL